MTRSEPLTAERTEAEIPTPNESQAVRRSVLPLTERQVQVLRSIEYSLATRGVPPSLVELCSMVGSSSRAAVVDHLEALERKGYLRRDAGVRRGLQVLVSSEDAVVLTPRPLAKALLCGRCRKANVA